MSRIGLLAALVFVQMNLALGAFPAITEVSTWYASSSLLPTTVFLGLALWSFAVSISGQRLFVDSVLD